MRQGINMFSVRYDLGSDIPEYGILHMQNMRRSSASNNLRREQCYALRDALMEKFFNLFPSP
jgi:hypothetical protein